MDVRRDQVGLPLEEIPGARIGWIRATVARCDVFEELHAGTGNRAKSRDAKPRSEDVIQMLLFGSVVVALTDLLESKPVAIKLETGFCIGNDNCGVIDPEKELWSLTMPLRVALSRR